MPGRTQNHPEMPRNLKVLRLKMPPCAKTAVFCRVIFFTLFLLPFFRHFWWISSPFGLPRSKRHWSVLGNFFVIFRFFLRFWLLLQFWSIFLAQGDQKCRKKRRKNKPNHQPRHQFLPPATPPASNERGLTSWPDLPMTSSSTLPSEWAGGGSGSAGSIRLAPCAPGVSDPTRSETCRHACSSWTCRHACPTWL